MSDFSLSESIDWVDDLSNNDFVILDNVLDYKSVSNLKTCFDERLKAEKFKKAAIGAQDQMQIDTSIRGDNIFWLDKDSKDPRIRFYFTLMNEIQSTLNRYCFLSLSDYEFHFAHYPPGAYYKRHLDQFQSRNNRLISTVFYLNDDWIPDYKGQLRLYLNSNYIDVEPKFGRLVLFKSADIEHEVLTTYYNRYSITGWMLYKPIGLEIF
ncbi:MAG: 2OG-Fe(II) oxygenase [Cytophagales bacterium]